MGLLNTRKFGHNLNLLAASSVCNKSIIDMSHQKVTNKYKR